MTCKQLLSTDTGASSSTHDSDSSRDSVVTQLDSMGFSREQSFLALERCGSGASMETLVDFILMIEAPKIPADHNRCALDDGHSLQLSKPALVDTLQRLAGCASETARTAVDVFGDDPMYAQLDDKIQVMLDWVAAYTISGSGAENTKDPEFKEVKVEYVERFWTTDDHDRDENGLQFKKVQNRNFWERHDHENDGRQQLNKNTFWPRHNHEEDHGQQVKKKVPRGYCTADDHKEDIKQLKKKVGYDRVWTMKDPREDHGKQLSKNAEYDRFWTTEDNCFWRADDHQEDAHQQWLESQHAYGQMCWEMDEKDLEESYPVNKKQKMVDSFPRGQMTGYGVPGHPMIPRALDKAIVGPPFFYLENVSMMPKGEWNNISRHLSGVKPEFTDSRYFTACRRPRGYIHNLPVEGRREITPKAPMTIKDLIPACRDYWPAWDPRTFLNCIITTRPTECVYRKVEQLLECWSDRSKPPEAHIREQVLQLARKWNLVWIKPGGLGPLTVNEIEQVMGYDKDHTRILYQAQEQLKCLGNSFQVHTVGYHLSVLASLYPRGLRVLALFAGLGGAEVALHKLGIRLNVVVSVDNNEKARRVIAHWWKASNQSGELISKYTDVRELDREILGKLLAKVGGFDLVIGGSPCTNLSGMNRFTRDGLAGESSILFFEFPRILSQVRDFMARRRNKRDT